MLYFNHFVLLPSLYHKSKDLCIIEIYLYYCLYCHSQLWLFNR